MTKSEMLNYFLEHDFRPYLVEVFFDTGICKHEESLDEFIIDLQYDFKRYGFDGFAKSLDREDFAYFPELEGIMKEWPDRLWKMLTSTDVLKIPHSTDSSCTFSIQTSKSI